MMKMMKMVIMKMMMVMLMVDDDEDHDDGEVDDADYDLLKRRIFDAFLVNPACGKAPVHKSASVRSFFRLAMNGHAQFISCLLYPSPSPRDS